MNVNLETIELGNPQADKRWNQNFWIWTQKKLRPKQIYQSWGQHMYEPCGPNTDEPKIKQNPLPQKSMIEPWKMRKKKYSKEV